ncbi:MAG: FG-GAP repeat domain-containing protein [Phycisphaeraceae bacterium]
MRLRYRSILTAGCLLIAFTLYAEHKGPWPRHTIDNSSKGADGVRLGDINGDGLMDIVTGWEEGGVVRLYLNPGPEKSKDKWPAVTVGKVNNVEDAVLVDLDNDGTMDVVSSCEGKTKTMYVHWGPKDQAKLLDEDAWQTEPIPATAGKQVWMYCLPMQIDGERGTDLMVGSKGKGAAVGWLESPEDPRDLQAWRYHKIRDAGWIMSIEPVTSDWPNALITDRKGEHRGIYTLGYHRDRWASFEIEMGKGEYMFAATIPGHGFDWVTATRDGEVRLFAHNHLSRAYRDITTIAIPNPFGVRHGKAVAVGKIDADHDLDFVVSHNTQGQRDKPGIALIRADRRKHREDWPAHDISGTEGAKFDRIELIDLDGDGDLDVLTCEEATNLGVIWYENPYGKAGDE